MIELDEHGRPEPPAVGDEAATLLGFLEYQRATLAWKCDGLSAAQLATPSVHASSMTLGGLLKHLAYVEDDWFSRWLQGADAQSPWDAVDWQAGPEQPARRTWPDGRTPSLRWILCHLIEEYARHNGHADLLRETLDGQTGE